MGGYATNLLAQGTTNPQISAMPGRVCFGFAHGTLTRAANRLTRHTSNGARVDHATDADGRSDQLRHKLSNNLCAINTSLAYIPGVTGVFSNTMIQMILLWLK